MRISTVLAALCCLSVSASLAADPNKIHPQLSEKFAGKKDNETVRVVISLEDYVPKGKSRKNAIQDSQSAVIGAFKNENNGKGLSVMTRYQGLFGFSAELTRGQANALAKRGEVTFLQEMPVHYKHFPESHPLTEVNLAQTDYSGVGAVIAIIDDGIDASHPAFASNYRGGRDFADLDADPTIDCAGQSHGTAVAGVAVGNYPPNVLGVAPDAEFLMLKIQSASICGSSSLDGDIIGAIDWATANKATYGIDIISMSLGGGLYSSESSCDTSNALYRQAVEQAAAAGISVIAASGNDGMCDSMSRPACFSSVISVGATFDETTGQRPGWCVNRNSCANTQRHRSCGQARAAFQDEIADHVIVYSNSASFLDVTAPSRCAQTATPGGGFQDCFEGTSSATPFTSGVAALVIEAREVAGKGKLSPADMLTILSTSGDPVTDPKNGRPSPRVNGQGAVLLAKNFDSGTPVNNPPVANFSSGCTELSCSFYGGSSSDPDNDDIVTYTWDFGDLNGTSGSSANVNHTYASGGTYTVTLTVFDENGASDSTSSSVSPQAAVGNQSPTADFTFKCTDLACDFTDASNDPDGSVATWSWNFGGEASSSSQNPSHPFSAPGTYSVTLSVTDNEGASSNVASKNVEVTDGNSGGSDYDLSGSSVNNKSQWTARVVDGNGEDLSGGSWSTGDPVQCSPSNTCELTGIRKKVGSVTFTAPDGVTSITILKP